MKHIMVVVALGMLTACSQGLPSHYNEAEDRANHQAYLKQLYEKSNDYILDEYIDVDCYMDGKFLVCETL